MSDREWQDYLVDMITYGDVAVQIVSDANSDVIGHDAVRRLALERALSIMGEAAIQIPPAIRLQHGHVPWPQIIALRHRLVHGYSVVDHQRLYEIASGILPDTLVQLRSIAAQAG